MRVVIIQRLNPKMELADGTKVVVDPEVQAYVSSLVTAVCFVPIPRTMVFTNKFPSLVAAVRMKMDAMCLETTPSPVYET